MATKPGFLTDWPWKHLGSFKYIILAPWGMQSIYRAATQEGEERDYTNMLIIPFLLWRALHNQIWISISRYRTAKGNNRIVDRSIEFEQVDRESNWDDQILLNGILLYFFNTILGKAAFLPVWRTDGVIITILLHAGPVEYIYYWLHRALHHHYLYSRYHSHHHSSIVTEPITSVIHPFAEHISYFLLFAIPILGTVLNGTASLASIFGYITYIDLMNNMGHCNFELIPKWAFSLFPPLKYIMYTPSSDALYETALKRQEDCPDVVHLTHLTTPESIFHLQFGLASFASRPQSPKWYMWPLTCWSMMLTFIFKRTFVVERNALDKFKLQTWAIPRYSIQYSLKWQAQAINDLIEEAILEAEARGAKGEELNRNGALFVEKYPKLNINIVDGSSLAIALVLNSIPKGTTEILFRGSLSKVAYAIVCALCQQGIQVATFYENEKLKLSAVTQNKVIVAKSFTQKVWIVGDGVSDDEQLNAPKGTLFIPFSQFPPKKTRNDAFYYHTPSMLAPPSLHNLHSCENWLPRRVMSAWRVAGIVHALEGWDVHECGDTIFDVKRILGAALRHGFRPTTVST
ncbi:UNVERIFIED_CONTAM: Very-long-chain aldehyde decarbonylase CER1 [Sesamum radiatum]|uniref:Very-long-chain aldehyde decarbonylase CER1 n=1 Tax=Sesamum radiatum TaxID=300843 RepID=A0AAW2VJM7_SESRA